MVIKNKCYFLKEGINPEILNKYGFETFNNGESYWLEGIVYYNDTRRFVNYYHGSGRIKYTKTFLKDLIKDNLVEVKKFYIWLCIFGRWQNYSQKKIDKIYDKIITLNQKKI